MPDIRWRIEGANRVANNLRHWATKFPGVLNEEIGLFTINKAQELQRKAYPPERPGQKYVRTWRLKLGWLGRRIKPAVWSLENRTPYAGWVVDQRFQAWMHRGRWWIFQDEIRPIPDLTKKLTAALRAVIKD